MKKLILLILFSLPVLAEEVDKPIDIQSITIDQQLILIGCDPILNSCTA